jgi:hypothetical protein
MPINLDKVAAKIKKMLTREGINLVEQLDRDISEAESEITRLGGAAFIEKSEPIIEELKVYFDNLYESLKRSRPEEVEK